MKRNYLRLIIFIIVAVLLGGFGYGVYKLFFAPNDTVVAAFDEGKLNVVVGGDVVDNRGEPRMVDGRILLPLPLVRQYIDPNINWDKEAHKLTITTKDRVIRMKTGSLEAYVNNKPVDLNIPVTENNGSVLVPIEYLSELYGIKISFNNDNNVIIIDFENSIDKVAEPIKSGAVVRTGQSTAFPIVKKMEGTEGKERELRVFKEDEKWYKVRTAEGAVGYIEKRFVGVKTVPAAEPEQGENKVTVWKPQTGKINMAWDYAYNMKSNLSDRAVINGLDVISPTWFQVVGADGEVENHADGKYVEWAHKRGYKVWALFSNNFSEGENSGEFLNNTDSRDNAIRQLLAFAALYKLDGINIDFEGLKNSDKNALTQFVRELSPLLREQGLVVSVDVNLLPCYDRKALGESADYVALMAYDQHWSGGGVVGSVAQLDWTDQAVSSFLKDVPAEKLILGMPFYTRLWKETPDGGKIKLSSQALSMKGIQKLLEENKAQKTWDEESGQFHSEFIRDGATYEVWLEDENSLNLRTSLAQKYELAGAAAWRLDFEVPEVWNVISHNLKDIGSYAEWQLENKSGQYAFSGD